MANHIDYDREENKIELILDSQGNVISTLVVQFLSARRAMRFKKRLLFMFMFMLLFIIFSKRLNWVILSQVEPGWAPYEASWAQSEPSWVKFDPSWALY